LPSSISFCTRVRIVTSASREAFRVSVLAGSPSSATILVLASARDSILSSEPIVPKSEPPEDMSKNG
jgi:hypothetical protein